MKKPFWLRAIHKGYLTAIGGSLALLTWAAVSTLAKWGALHAWTEKEVSTTRLGLSFLVLGLLGFDGWIRFWQVRKEKAVLEKHLEEALKPRSSPRHFLDDFVPYANLGMFRHNPERPGLNWLCGKCLAGEQKISYVQEFDKYWICPVCKSKFHDPKNSPDTGFQPFWAKVI